MKHILWLLIAVSSFLHAAEPIRVQTITPNTGIDNAYLSFDGDITTSWFPGWSVDPGVATISFDGVYRITKIRYFDGTGQPSLVITAQNGGTGNKTIHLSQYWLWLNESCDITAQSLKIEIRGIQGDHVIPDIEFWGEKVNSNVPVPETPPLLTATDAGAQINLNGFHWIPLDKMKPFKKKRDFQMSGWTWSQYGFSPDPLWGAAATNVQGYDKYFADAKAQGLEIIPCVNETPEWFWNLPPLPSIYATEDMEIPYWSPKNTIVSTTDTLNDLFPVSYATDVSVNPKKMPVGSGGDKYDPSAYIEYARFMFQYAARYGRQKWSNEAIYVNPEQPYPNGPVNTKKSGLDLLNYIEPWNEADAWWLDTTIYAQPEQLAAFMSAIYDGHCGTLGNGVGIHSADSTMKVVFPGLTGPDKKYYERVVTWCRKHRRDKSLPWDIANFHHYSNTGNQAGRWPPTWIAGAPLDCDNAITDVKLFIEYAKSLGQQVWWTEMGYDTKPPSWQYAVPYSGMTSDQLQAAWLVRNYILGISMGIDQIFMFNAINEPGAPNGGLYQNSGMLFGAGDQTPFAPKLSYLAVTKMIEELNGYQYAADISPSPKVKMLVFKSKTNSKVIYWSATMNGTSVTVKYQNKYLIVTETPKILSLEGIRSVSTKNNPISRVFNLSKVPRIK